MNSKNFRLYLFTFILMLKSNVDCISQCYECNPCPTNERTVRCPDSSYVVIIIRFKFYDYIQYKCILYFGLSKYIVLFTERRII